MSQDNTGFREFDEGDLEGFDEDNAAIVAESEAFRLRDPEGWVAQRLKDYKALIAGYPEVDAAKAIAEAEAGFRLAAAQPPAAGGSGQQS